MLERLLGKALVFICIIRKIGGWVRARVCVCLSARNNLSGG